MALWSQRATRLEEAKFDIKFEISNLNNPIIHMHIAPRNQYGDLRGHGSLKTASEAASDVKFELSDLDYIYTHIFLGSKGLYWLNDTTTKTTVQNALGDQRVRFAPAGKNLA